MSNDSAETGNLQVLLSQIGAGLDEYLKFEHPDALHPDRRWHEQLNISLPQTERAIMRRGWGAG
jgi:aromatic-L-amino-acid decarboxylase